MRIKGIVRWFNDSRGFGFVAPEDGGKHCFLHYSAIRGDGLKSLTGGQQIEFEIVQRLKGPVACNVIAIGA